MRDPAMIVTGMNEAQRVYLRAVAASTEPYYPRHGRTANWALRHGLVDTQVRLQDGRSGPWNSFDVDDRAATGIADMGGQVLTKHGRAILVSLSPLEKGSVNG